MPVGTGGHETPIDPPRLANAILRRVAQHVEQSLAEMVELRGIEPLTSTLRT
jgi:siroheme synthase (precorrin-2 oxidase/ferrochelatase)